MVDTKFKKAQAQCKEDYDNQGRPEPHFATGDHIFLEDPPTTTSAADGMAYKGYFKLLPRCNEPSWIISVSSKYAKMDEIGAQATVTINQLTKVTKKGRPKTEFKSDQATDDNDNPACNASDQHKSALF